MNHRLVTPSPDTVAVVEFDCPRCRQLVTETYFGPCSSCRGELRAALTREAVELEVAEYVPKVNVTPNAVALRDE